MFVVLHPHPLLLERLRCRVVVAVVPSGEGDAEDELVERWGEAWPILRPQLDGVINGQVQDLGQELKFF